MIKNFIKLAALPLALSATYSYASTITFSNFQHAGSDAVNYIVTIADDNEAGVTAGNFKVSYQVDPLSSFTTAKLTGLFFDVADPFIANNGPYSAANLGLINVTAPASCGQAFNTDQVVAGGGCNTNINFGAAAGSFQNHQFDVGIAWKNGNDLSSGAVGMFEIADLGLTLADWAAVGLRGQATDGTGGSAKEFQIMPDTVIPVPASVWLFGSGLIGLAGIARRRS